MKRFRLTIALLGGLAAFFTQGLHTAHALSGAEYLGLESTNRAIHVMGMVEAFKYADELSGDGRLGWLFQCVGGWTGTQLETVFTNYLETHPMSRQYRAPSLFVSAVGNQCPNAPIWAQN